MGRSSAKLERTYSKIGMELCEKWFCCKYLFPKLQRKLKTSKVVFTQCTKYCQRKFCSDSSEYFKRKAQKSGYRWCSHPDDKLICNSSSAIQSNRYKLEERRIDEHKGVPTVLLVSFCNEIKEQLWNLLMQ